MVAMQRHGPRHGVALALQALVVDAGAAPDPVLRLAAPQAMIDGRGDRRVADAHFAKAEQVGARGERLHAEGHRRRAALFIERRALRDVAGRHFQREFEDL